MRALVASQMDDLNTSDLVWNRACIVKDGVNPQLGDQSLAALILFHSVAMNGGVLHALECCDSSQLSAAEAGYRYFGFSLVAELISRGRQLDESSDDLEATEKRLDGEYAEMIPDDSFLKKRFENHFAENPKDYAEL